MLLAFILVAAVPRASLAASSDPNATQRPPSCDERYPAEGPAGVDLRLGCVITELVGAYVGLRGGSEPPRASAYLGATIAVLLLAAVLVALLQLARRRLGKRLAPVAPTTFWTCPACRSLNAAGTVACYRCRAPWTPEADAYAPTDTPPSQGFGRRHDR